MQERNSRFTGTVGEHFGLSLLIGFLSVITLGIYTPWGIVRYERWVKEHTYVGGHQLYFDGTGGQLFINCIKWSFLTLITLGIYGFWVPVKLFTWQAKYTHIKGNLSESSFDGTVMDCFVLNLINELLILITLGIYSPWAYVKMTKWQFEHTIIAGSRVTFKGTGEQLFGNSIKWFFLTLITLGIYGFWVPVKRLQWQYGQLNFSGDITGGDSSVSNGNISGGQVNLNSNRYVGQPQQNLAGNVSVKKKKAMIAIIPLLFNLFFLLLSVAGFVFTYILNETNSSSSYTDVMVMFGIGIIPAFIISILNLAGLVTGKHGLFLGSSILSTITALFQFLSSVLGLAVILSGYFSIDLGFDIYDIFYNTGSLEEFLYEAIASEYIDPIFPLIGLAIGGMIGLSVILSYVSFGVQLSYNKKSKAIPLVRESVIPVAPSQTAIPNFKPIPIVSDRPVNHTGSTVNATPESQDRAIKLLNRAIDALIVENGKYSDSKEIVLLDRAIQILKEGNNTNLGNETGSRNFYRASQIVKQAVSHLEAENRSKYENAIFILSRVVNILDGR